MLIESVQQENAKFAECQAMKDVTLMVCISCIRVISLILIHVPQMDKAKLYQGKLQNIKKDMYAIRDKSLKLQVKGFCFCLVCTLIVHFAEEGVKAPTAEREGVRAGRGETSEGAGEREATHRETCTQILTMLVVLITFLHNKSSN